MDKTVLVVGCGGLGGYVIEELARLGVKRLVLFDGDTFCESNMNRQLESGWDTLGKEKVLVYKERLKRKFGTSVDARVSFLTEDNADVIQNVDLVMDCVDNIKTRLFLEEACEKYGKILVHGGLEGSFGQACLCYPGEKTLQKLYVHKNEKKHLTNAFTVATVSSMQVSLAYKVLTGQEEEVKEKLFLLDMESLHIDEVPM